MRRSKGSDSDLKVIDEVCKYYNIPSIIGFDKRGIPYIRGYDYQLCRIDPYYAAINKFDWYYHIDLYEVYKKPMIKSIIYKNVYKDLKLDTVCRAIINEGKYRNLDGQQVQRLNDVANNTHLPIAARQEEKNQILEYVGQDSKLVMRLAQHNNYEILDLMNAISIITSLRFDRICHTGLSTWWAYLINKKIVSGECRWHHHQTKRVEKSDYKGGQVIEPVVGYYDKEDQPVYVLDVKSLYPTMIIANNISFETVNCSCCEHDSNARVSSEIMNLINKDLPKDQKRNGTYWICKDPTYRGVIPRLLEEYRSERFRQQELGNNAMQLALKNLINGIYGLFGSKFFEFSDYRVAELVTAFGRRTLGYMKHIATAVYGFKVIYGDTDSIFVTSIRKENDINKFLAECSIMLEDVEIELSKVYARVVITKKKHYIGIFEDMSLDPDIKGMEGIKSNKPPWINQIQYSFVDDLKYGRDPTSKLKKAYIDMEQGTVPKESLEIKLTLKKNPEEYDKNTVQRIVGLAQNAREGDTISYYKSNTKGGGTSNPNLYSRFKYLEMLKSTMEDQLNVIGYDFMRDVVGLTSLRDV
jgi:DNA polymerase, archaea type